ncbi:ABC transporter permease [Microbacterium sp. NPDC012755]|uniref:ABC transporter permease n=1 Tax=Microbacterium sp. NPDC012755 TaxID=3364184 RepID=UPI0036758BED
MTAVRALLAELRKLMTLPGVWIGCAVTIAGFAGIALLNAFMAKDALLSGDTDGYHLVSVFDSAYAAAPLGTVGAVIVGVLAIGSEYSANTSDAGGGRQITSTLLALPRRGLLIAAKAAAVLLVGIATGIAALAAGVGISVAVIGDLLPFTTDDSPLAALGALLYWALTGLIAFGITALVRSVIVPLIILIVNNTVVSVSVLLANLTPLAYWLPDMAGRKLFSGLDMMEGGLGAATGALVMAAWALAFAVAGAVVFARRDA